MNNPKGPHLYRTIMLMSRKGHTTHAQGFRISKFEDANYFATGRNPKGSHIYRQTVMLMTDPEWVA